MAWGRIFRIGGGIGIVLALVPLAATVLGTLSDFRYRHIDQTANLLIGLSPNKAYRREAEIIALEYNSKEIYIPFCRLRGCLVRNKIDVRGINLYLDDASTESKGATLEGLDLSEGRVFESDFREANIADSNLANVLWSKLNLSAAQFGHSSLRCAKILNSDLRNAKFIYSNLRGATFFGSNIGNSRFWMESPSSAGMDENTLRGAWIWEGETPLGLENYPKLQTYDICKRNRAQTNGAAIPVKPAPEFCLGPTDETRTSSASGQTAAASAAGLERCPAMSLAEQYVDPIVRFFY